MRKFSNLIGGYEFSLMGEDFEAKSPFYDYKIQITNASEMDVDAAVKYALESQTKLRQLGYTGRRDILKRASENINFDDFEIEHATRMMGMPIKRIKQYADEVPIMLSKYSDSLESRTQVVNGNISRVFTDVGYIEIKDALEGFGYSIVPSNDPRALAFVFSVFGTLGIPAVLKISKNELPIAHKIAKTVIEAGYPAEALNLLCWNTEDHVRARQLHFYVSSYDPTFFIPFGNDDTVDEQLRYEERSFIRPGILAKHIGRTLDEKLINEITEVEKIDRLRGNVFRHTSGNCAVIVDGFSDRAVELTGYSAFEYPISCKSAKSAYFIGNKRDFETFKRELSEYANNLVVGDPLSRRTDVGFVDGKTLSSILQTIQELRVLGQAEVVYGGEVVRPNQATPLIVSVDDLNSPLLTKENSIYILTLKRVDSLEQAVDECNLYGRKQRLAVSVISDREDSGLSNAMLNLRSDQAHLNQITRFLHPPVHQGVAYPERMSRTISVYLGTDKMSKLPISSDKIKKSYKVLFVDDEQEIAQLIEEQMIRKYKSDKDFSTKNKIDTLVCYSGEEAIETIRRNPDIDMIVTDMRMGGMTGGRTIREAKKINPGIVGIVVTAYSGITDREDAREAGIMDLDYIKKPYDSDMLWDKIKSKLNLINR